jgi:hypothetical protein
MAWLSVTLEADPKLKAKPKNRWNQYKDRGEDPILPENPAPYLTDWLFDVGPTATMGLGEGAVTYTELANWQMLAGITLEPWEAKVLRQLSAAYAAEQYDARKPNHPAPYAGDKADMAAAGDRVAMQLKAIFGGAKRG